MVTVILDGYNVIHALPALERQLDRGLEAAREALVSLCRSYQSRRGDSTGSAYFTTQRVPRILTEREKRFGKESSYAGSEVYLSLVDGQNAPFHGDLRQAAVEANLTRIYC